MTHFLKTSLLVIAALATSFAPAFADNAQWITTKSVCGAGSWLCFRKTVELPAKPGSARVRIAADSKYWLWVNRKMAVFEGELKRGPTPRDSYADEIDLAPWLRQGSNTIAALVCFFGKDGFSHNDSGKAAFFLSGSGPLAVLSTGSSWKTLRHPAYGAAGDPRPNYRLPEPNIRFDARRDIGDWTAPDFNDDAWPPARERGCPPREPWGALFPRPIPQWKNPGLRDYAGTTGSFPRQSNGRDIRLRLPYNAQITPYLKIEAPAGFLIDIRTDDYNKGHDPSIRAEYITREGVQEYESYGWMNGHEVCYSIPAGIKILALKYRETGYDTDFTGRFHCNDDTLNLLWKKARRTLYVNMRDSYMDCPDRERAQWWGDEALELEQAFYAFDPARGPLLARKGILELARWARPDGTLYAPIPAGLPRVYLNPSDKRRFFDGSFHQELPQQMLAALHGVSIYYLYTGDVATLREVYPAVKRYLELWKWDASGLVLHRQGNWDWSDWGQGTDTPVLENAWLGIALRAALRIARATGNPKEAATYEARLARLRPAFQSAFRHDGLYASEKHRAAPDDRANALAVVAGFPEPGDEPAIRRLLASTENASPYMEKYVLEALYLMHAPGEALARMKRRYDGMIQSDTTTLWEFFGSRPEEAGRGTYNHAWSGGPLTVLSRYAAGISPTEPGWKKFKIAPQPGPLTGISATVPTPQGNIEMALERSGSGWRMNLTVPEGTQAKVRPPMPGSEPWNLLIKDGKQLPARDRIECGPGKHLVEIH